MRAREVESARRDYINDKLTTRIKIDDVFPVPNYRKVGRIADGNHGWPKWAIDSLYNVHKTRGDRLSLMAFFIRNGLEPEIAHNYTMWHHQFGYRYDKSALADNWGMVEAMRTRGEKNPSAYKALMNKPVFDMETGNVERQVAVD